MIKLVNLSKSFILHNNQRFKILDEINYTFESKGKYAILGRNGSGKSTLISMICGIQKPDKGGKIIKTVQTSWPIGFGGNFQGSLTGKENVEFVCKIFGKTHEETAKALEYCRDWSEIGQYFYEPVKNYSSGMKARLNFATSMAFDFDFYLIDEVTATGDMFFVEKAKKELFIKLKDKGFIMVSHAFGEIRDICTHFAVLQNKKLIFYENFKEAFAVYKDSKKTI